MSKYVIDTTLDNVKKVIAMGVTKGGAIWTDTTDIENLEELNSDYINEHFGDLQDTAYQRGLNDAWEAAKKLFSSMADSDMEKAFPIEWNNGGFNALMNLQPQEAIEKLKAYEQKQKADDKIEVGDEVEVLNSGNKYLIAWFAGTSLCGFAHDGVTCRLQPSDVRKTGRHFDIASILEAMKHD